MKWAAAIRTKTRQIEAQGGRAAGADDTALQMMVDLWPLTLDTVRQCGGWTATAGADFMAQLDAMRGRPKRGDGEKLDALAQAIENDARSLGSAADALTAAAERRRSDERARLLSRAPAVPAGLRLPGLGAPATDLAPVRERLMALDRCRSRLKWITALERIDEPAKPFQFAPEAPSERASDLAQALALAASELHSVAAAVASQAAVCRCYSGR